MSGARKESVMEAGSFTGRLDKVATPLHYKMEISCHPGEKTFAGQSSILLKLEEARSEIVLHALELEIDKAVLRNGNGRMINGSVDLDESWQIARIHLEEPAEAGRWFLDLQFKGVLNDKLRGFYLSTYKDSSGEDKYIAVTKFEPSDARRAFPCFDEPEFKAVFELSLIVDARLTAISNSPILAEEDLGDGKKKMRFAPTIKMSSYLVAYVIGELVSSPELMSKSGTPIRIWSVPGKEKLSSFGLKWAKESLDYFADYFGIDYPGEKLDLVAIPDFASGAMENFACITFRETALLLDEASATGAECKRVAEVICHENAHMWFGDLVTMSWWNGLWLNEAFATFMAAKAIEKLSPEWKFWQSFNIEKSAAMRVDGLRNSRSIEFPVKSPEDARAMFDILTYEKGCAILRMLELFLGPELFRKGCAIYMKRHAYANTETSDLWDALETAASEAGCSVSVSQIMHGWVYQMGFPLLSVSRSAEDPQELVLHQSAFRYLQLEVPEKSLWHIPLSYRAGKQASSEGEYMLVKAESETHKLAGPGEFFLANSGGNGFFRVEYGDDLRTALFARLGELSASERFNLASDLWASCQAGKLSLKAYLHDLQNILSCEVDNNVFLLAAGSLSYLRRVVYAESPGLAENLESLAEVLFWEHLQTLGFEGAEAESLEKRELRGMLFGLMGSFSVKKLFPVTEKLWQRFKEQRASIESNLLAGLVSAKAANGDMNTFLEFMELKEKARTPQEENRYLFALAAFKQQEVLAKALELINKGAVRKQDKPLLLYSLLQNPWAGELGWSYIRDNWQALADDLPLQAIIRLIDAVANFSGGFCRFDEISSFLQSGCSGLKGTEKALAQSLEQVAIARDFLARERSGFSALSDIGLKKP